MIRFIRSAFNDQKWFRLFIVLQILFIAVLIIYDLTDKHWDLFLSYNRGNIKMSSSLDHWRHKYLFGNYLTVATVLLPFFTAKSIDWILSSKDNTK